VHESENPVFTYQASHRAGCLPARAGRGLGRAGCPAYVIEVTTTEQEVDSDADCSLQEAIYAVISTPTRR